MTAGGQKAGVLHLVASTSIEGAGEEMILSAGRALEAMD
jgi:hypothetical protein